MQEGQVILSTDFWERSCIAQRTKKTCHSIALPVPIDRVRNAGLVDQPAFVGLVDHTVDNLLDSSFSTKDICVCFWSESSRVIFSYVFSDLGSRSKQKVGELLVWIAIKRDERVGSCLNHDEPLSTQEKPLPDS